MLAQVDPADGPARSHADGVAGSALAAHEYRIGELAREAGITVRTLRYYRERRLLPPPRREGRIGWYSQAHLDRLRVIGQLVDRGHTLGGIGELLSAWEQGYDLADLLGFERAMTAPWSDEVPVPVTVAELSALLGGQLTDEVLLEAIGLGYLDVDGDRVRISGRLLDTVTVLVREGIPLPAIHRPGCRPAGRPRAEDRPDDHPGTARRGPCAHRRRAGPRRHRPGRRPGCGRRAICAADGAARVPEDCPAVTEETFGPTLTIAKVPDMDEAVRRANASSYGLGAAVFSRAHGTRLARRIRAGLVAVNSVTLALAGMPSLPWGGTGQSGFGRIHGPDGLREFTTAKAIARQRFTAPLRLTTFARTARADKAVATLTTLRHGRASTLPRRSHRR